MTDQADALMGIFGFKRVEKKAMDKVRDARRGLFIIALDNRQSDRDKAGLDALTRGEVSQAWKAFNAALDAVEIVLPGLTGMDQPFTGTPISEIRAHNHYNRAIAQCRSAIESTNLGLRIK